MRHTVKAFGLADEIAKKTLELSYTLIKSKYEWRDNGSLIFDDHETWGKCQHGTITKYTDGRKLKYRAYKLYDNRLVIMDRMN